MNKRALQSALLPCLATTCIVACSSVDPEEDAFTDGPWTEIPARSDAIRISGHTDWDSDSHAVTGWSGTAYTVGFNGSGLKINITSGPAIYDIFIDGSETPNSTLDLSEGCDNCKRTVAQKLKPGNHYVRVQKNTEYFIGQAVLLGFDVQGDPAPEALPPLPERRLEFIGNSITCGYGILSSKPELENTSVFPITTENHYYTYAGQATRILGAEERTYCMSGRGFLRNFDNTTDGVIPTVYNSLSGENTESDSAARWEPDIVFINLGTNDFNQGVPDSTAFSDTVFDFIAKLRAKYPTSAITLLNGPMMSGESMQTCRRFLDAIAERFRRDVDENIFRFDFDPHGSLGYGIGYHPNKAQGLKDAQSLATWVKQTFRW